MIPVKLTVFTPTYNRAYCLHRVYESLCGQENKGFVWLVIDDGSTDKTNELVGRWKEEGKINIEYIYQENGGMHSTYNTAYANCRTELITCIDSDDYLADGAVEKILGFWKKYGSNKYAGIVGLDANFEGRIIGKQFPMGLKSSNLEDLYEKHKIPGDKKLVYRTEMVKKYPPYPSFEGENFVPHGSLFIQIDQDYELLLLNEVLVNVEYQQDGSTRNMFKQYRRHPQGWRYGRLVTINHTKYFKKRFINLIHLASTRIQLRDYNFLDGHHHPFLALASLPFGIILYFYIRYKNSNFSNK